MKAKTASAISAIFGYCVGTLVSCEDRPYIGIDFDNRKSADVRQSAGALPEGTMHAACKQAVEKYIENGATDSIVIRLPARPNRIEAKASNDRTP